jgi:hypothetical protein
LLQIFLPEDLIEDGAAVSESAQPAPCNWPYRRHPFGGRRWWMHQTSIQTHGGVDTSLTPDPLCTNAWTGPKSGCPQGGQSEQYTRLPKTQGSAFKKALQW